MKSAQKFSLVLVTAPDLKTARKLARAALKAKLIACANFIPKIESHYWWRGKIESGAEVLMLLKTTKAKLAKLERLILSVATSESASPRLFFPTLLNDRAQWSLLSDTDNQGGTRLG